MLEKPHLQKEDIVACLQHEYGFAASAVEFLPLGADQNTAVYRVVADDGAYGGAHYFLKLRSGSFDEASVALPNFLSDQGIKQIIAPMKTQTGNLSGVLDDFRSILYPFVDGKNGYEVRMTDQHWAKFGEGLLRIHTADVPQTLTEGIRRETFSPKARESVKTFLSQISAEDFDDPMAAQLAEFIRIKQREVENLVERTDCLAETLPAQSPDWIVCHSDLHAGNMLMANDGALYIVDWDEPILAPKERDLMYIGGGLLASGRTPQEEERLFYRTYGWAQIDPVIMAYYRYDRIIQDMAIYCEQLLLSDEGGEDRARSLNSFKSNFRPGGTIETAYRADSTVR